MFIFLPFIKIRPMQFCFIAFGIILRIPLILILLVLVPFLIQTLNAQPADITWIHLLGEELAKKVSFWLSNTQFALGIPLSFQQNGLTQLVVGCAFLSALLSFLNDYFLRDYGEKIAKKLRTDIAIKFLSLPFASALRLDAGFLASMVGTDAKETQQTFTRLTTSVLNDGLIAVIFIFWLMLLDYQLFILFMTILIPASLILTKTGKVLKKLAKRGLQFESELLSTLLERMRGWQTIQIYKAIPFEIKHFNRINHNIFNTWRRATRAKALGAPLIEWFGIIAALLIAVIALRRVYSGELTSAVLVGFIVTVGLLADKLNSITDQINSTKKGTESLRRILNFLKVDLGQRDIVNFDLAHKKNETLSSIEFVNLSITNNERTVLVENLSGLFKLGSFVLLIGPSGIGKTTFLNVLLGLYPPSIGKIFINNRPVNEKEYLHFSSQIGLIPQEPHIFHGSLMDNIFYPQKIENPTYLEIQQAQTALTLANLNLDLNAGVSGLSGGEKQRLMFARIFFNKPRLIIIDEGTSALDIENEIKILQTLCTNLNESIIFMVSHRSTAKEFATHVIDLSKYKNYV